MEIVVSEGGLSATPSHLGWDKRGGMAPDFEQKGTDPGTGRRRPRGGESLAGGGGEKNAGGKESQERR